MWRANTSYIITSRSILDFLAPSVALVLHFYITHYVALFHLSLDPAAQAAQARLQYTLHHYATKLKTFNSEELKAEVLKIGHRLALAGGRTTKISTTGTKEELQERILLQAMQILNGDTSCDDGEAICVPVKSTKSRAKATANSSTKATSKASAKITRTASIQSESESDIGSDDSSGPEEVTRRRITKTVKTKPAAAAVRRKESAASPSTRSLQTAITPAEAPVVESRRTSARVQAATITNSIHPTDNNKASNNRDEDSLHNSDSKPSIAGSKHSNAESDADESSEIEGDASVCSGVDEGSDGSDNDRIDMSDSESILLDAAVEVTIDNNTDPSGVDYDSDSSSHSHSSVNSVDSVDTSSVVSHNSVESENDSNSSDESIVDVPIKKRTRITKAQSLVDRDTSSSDVIKTEASKGMYCDILPRQPNLPSKFFSAELYLLPNIPLSNLTNCSHSLLQAKLCSSNLCMTNWSRCYERILGSVPSVLDRG